MSLGTDISWKRILAKSRALEASDKSIAVSMLEVVQYYMWKEGGGGNLIVVLRQRANVENEISIDLVCILDSVCHFMLSWHFDVSLEFMMWDEAEAYCGIEVDVSLQGTRQLQTMLAIWPLLARDNNNTRLDSRLSSLNSPKEY